MNWLQDIIRWTNNRPILSAIAGASVYLLANPKRRRKKRRR